MGRRIAGELALNGAEVTMCDRDLTNLQEAHQVLKAEVDMLHQRGLVSSEDVNLITTEISLKDNIEEAVADADIVVESVIEDLDIKREVIRRASRACPPNCIVTTNTMTCSITKVAQAAAHPENVVGFRFLYPVFLIEDVELTLALETDVQAAERIKTLAIHLGKKCFLKSPGKDTFHRLDPSMYSSLQREGAHSRNSRLGRLQRGQSQHKQPPKPSAPPIEGDDAASSSTSVDASSGSSKGSSSRVGDNADDDDDDDAEDETKSCIVCLSQPKVSCPPVH